MQMYRLYFLLFILFSSLYAEEEIQGRLSADQQPQATVGGCVNAVSGSFFFSETDLPATGLGTLQLIRTYDSRSSEKGFFGKGMSHTFPTNLRAKEKKDSAGHKGIEASLATGESSSIPYSGPLKTGRCSIKSDFKRESGYTGSFNPLNRLEPHLGKVRISSDEKGKWTVQLSNGAKRYFEHKKKYDHRLVLEELPNGQQHYYRYFSKKSISISQLGADDSELSLLWMSGGDRKYARLDGKKKCAYHFDSKDRLKKVEGDHLPTQDYEYDTSGRIIKLWKGGNKYLKVNYFSTDKYHRGKVKNIQRCIGYDYEKLYTFSYKKDKTIVTCPLKNRQVFRYKNHRITQFDDCEAFRSWKYRYTKLADIKSIALYDTKDASVCKHYVEYSYDNKGNPLSKRVYGQITGNQDDSISFFKHEPIEGQLFQETVFEYSDDEFNLLTKEIKPNGTELHYTYYPQTSLIASKRTISNGVCQLREFYSYNSAGFKTEVVEDDGSGEEIDDFSDVTYRIKTENVYKKLLPISSAHYFQNLETGEWNLLSRKENVYDTYDQLIEQKTYDANDSYVYSIFKDYDAHGNITSEVNAIGELTLFGYDRLDRKITEEHFGTGKITHFHYNRWNELVKEIEEHENGITLTTAHTYDLAGNRTSTTDWYGNETIYLHDRSSRLIATIDSEKNFESKQYDLFNHPVVLTDKRGNKTKKAYNIFGKVLSVDYPDGTKIQNQYYLDGNLHKKWEVDGSYIEYTYDYLDRAIREETFSPDGKSLAISTKNYKGKTLVSEVDARGVKTEYTYDCSGRRTSLRRGDYFEEYAYNPMGKLYCTKVGDRFEIKEFDNLGRVVEERVENASGELLRKKTFSFDRHGNVQLTREFTSPTEYSESQAVYNSHNLIESSIDPEGNVTTYHYEFGDQFVKVRIDPMGQEKWETYDHHNQCIQTEIRAFGEVYACQNNIYDAVGNCIRQVHDIYTDSEKTGEYSVEWEYNEMGQVVREIEQGLKFTETYYSLGRKECEIKPGGTSLIYGYDDFGRVSSLHSSDGTIHYEYLYDPVGNLIQSKDLVHNTLLERDYDENNNLIREQLPNGNESRYTYDHQGRLSKITLPDSSEVIYIHNAVDLVAVKRGGHEHRYTYDLAGNILSETGFHGEKVQFTYDANHRATSMVSHSFEQHLAFDPAGNVIQDNDIAYTYDQLYQLTSDRDSQYRYDSLNNRIEKNGESYSHNSLQQVTSDGDSDYAYDADGNRILKGDTHYRYDALNRLIETEGIYYQYDSFGRLMSRNEESFIYFKNYDLGNMDCLRLIGQGTIGIETSEGLFSTRCDYRGSVCVVLDKDLQKRAEYCYSAFGETEVSGDFHSPWQFYSQRVDIETGHLHFFKRVYDPVIGSWLTPDPLGFSEGPNLYAYVYNNPLRFCDPYGLSAMDFFKGFAEAAVQIGLVTVARYVALGVLTTACPPAGAVASALLTSYSVGMTAYCAGKFVYDNSDTLGEIGEKAMAGEVGELVAWGCDTICNMPHEQLGEWACDAAMMFTPVSKTKSTSNLKNCNKVLEKKVAEAAEKKVAEAAMKSCGGNAAKSVQNVSVPKNPLLDKFDLDALSKAGQAMDREGLTRAGRSLDKHGNRLGSPFPKAFGNPNAKNMQGQWHLDDILTDPFGKIKFDSTGSFQIYSLDGRGAYFYSDGTFRGFLDK